MFFAVQYSGFGGGCQIEAGGTPKGDGTIKCLMKSRPPSGAQAARLLEEAAVGSLAALTADGTPYITPVHFVYREGCVYIHGLPAGQKPEHIRRSPAVCFSVQRVDSPPPAPKENPCNTNTRYQSVTVQGRASLVTERGEKARILRGLVEKYAPQLWDQALPETMVRETAVLRVEPDSITGECGGLLLQGRLF